MAMPRAVHTCQRAGASFLTVSRRCCASRTAAMGRLPSLKESSSSFLDGLEKPYVPELDKKKLLGVRSVSWLRIDEHGQMSVVALTKAALIRKFRLNPRDGRLLDPYLATSYPSTIQCRDSALVVNLEYIRWAALSILLQHADLAASTSCSVCCS